MTRAYSYRRFSTPEQAAGDSLRRQTSMAADYCQRHGLTLDTELNMLDAGVSAFKGKNLDGTACLGAFLEAVKAGDVPAGSVLLVEALDRITRKSANRAAAVVQDIVDAGVDVVTLNDGKRYSAASLTDGMDYLFIVIQAMRAHDESANKSRRVKAAWTGKRERAAGGALLTRMVPAWIKLAADGKRTLDPVRVKIVRKIFERYAAGAGKAAICHELNADKVPSFGRGKRAGRGWSKPYIDLLLRGKAAIGTLATGDTAIEGYYPVAVDKALWARVQARLTQDKGTRSHGSTFLVMNVLSGLGRCSHCGAPMTRLAPGHQYPGRTPVLVCSAARDKGQCEPGKARIPLPPIEAALKQLLAYKPPSSTAGLDDLVAAARDRVAMLTEHISTLVDQIEHSPSASLSKRLHEREEALPKAQADLAALEAQHSTSDKRSVLRNYGRLAEALKAKRFDIGAVNAALKTMLNRVVVDSAREELVLSWKHNGETRLHYGDEPAPYKTTAEREFVDLSE